MIYRCSVCMYEFDEKKEGKKFEDLPEDYRCPECGSLIYYFEKDYRSEAKEKAEKQKEESSKKSETPQETKEAAPVVENIEQGDNLLEKNPNGKIDKWQFVKYIIAAIVVLLCFQCAWIFAVVFGYFFPTGRQGYYYTRHIALDNEADSFLLEIGRNYVKVYDMENSAFGYKIHCDTKAEVIKFEYKGHKFEIRDNSASKGEFGGIIMSIDGIEYAIDKSPTNGTYSLRKKTENAIVINAFE